MKYIFLLLLVPLLTTPAFGAAPLLPEDYEQIIPSENGTLNIGLSVDPPAKANEVSKLHIGWIKPGFNKIQEHIDYKITVIKDGQNIFGPIPLTHTSVGTVKIPVEFTSNGEHQVKIEMEGILFQPIPLETTYFTINVGKVQIQNAIVESAPGSSTPGCEPDCFVPSTITIENGGTVTFANPDNAAHTSTSGTPADGPNGIWNSGMVRSGSSFTTLALEIGEYPYFCIVHPWMTGLVIVGNELPQTEVSETNQKNNEEGGGCLIATAAFGSEMAPQVQFLREIRDGTVMSTQSGTAFMTGFNQFYYSFSPAVADLERENPIFKEMVKVTLTPMLTSLTLLNYVDVDTEEEMLGYGIGIILLNIGMYFVAPVVLFTVIKKKLRK